MHESSRLDAVRNPCLAVVSLLQVHYFSCLFEVTLPAVLNLIQPHIACEGGCAKEPSRSGESKVMILEPYTRPKGIAVYQAITSSETSAA